jgi:hypothetical protein
MCVPYQTTLTKITNKSSIYKIMSYNMTLNLNIFKIVLSFALYNIGQARRVELCEHN